MSHARAELGRDHAAEWGPPHLDHESGEPDARARVLVEVPDGAEASALWQALGKAGYAVSWCPGPERARGRSCPLVTRGICPLMDEADVVLSALGSPVEPWRAVLEAQVRHHPDTPVVIGASAVDAARLKSLPTGCRHIRSPLTVGSVLGALEDALTVRWMTSPAPGSPGGDTPTVV